MKTPFHGATRTMASARRVRSTGALVSALALAFTGSAFLAQSSAAAEPAEESSNLMTDVQINQSLDQLAKKMAVGMGRADLRTSIHGAVKKRFDGDTEALWSSLAKDSTFSTKVAGNQRASDAITTEAAKIPRLQVAVPAHFDSWDPATYAPLVAYFPEGVEDTSVKTITAYDSAGHAVQLDAQVEPKQPVIVLSLNERTDDQGNLIKSPGTSAKTTEASQSLVAAKAAATYSVDVMVVELKNDMEPWAKGDAEISMKARSRGCSGTDYEDHNWSGLENSGDIWGASAGRNIGSTKCDVVFAWWEDDGGAFNYTLSFDSFNLGVAMDDSDDIIGKKQLAHSSFKGSSMTETKWSALEMWTQ